MSSRPSTLPPNLETPLDFETPEGHYWLERLADWQRHPGPWVDHNGIVFDARWRIQVPTAAVDRAERLGRATVAPA